MRILRHACPSIIAIIALILGCNKATQEGPTPSENRTESISHDPESSTAEDKTPNPQTVAVEPANNFVADSTPIASQGDDDLLIRYAPSRAVWAVSLMPKRLNELGLGVAYEDHDVRFVPGLSLHKASDIERVVLFGAPGDPRRMETVGVVVHLAAGANTEAIATALGRNATRHEFQGKTYLSVRNGCLFFPDPRTLVIAESALDMEPIIAGTNRPRELVKLLLQADRKAELLACSVSDHGGTMQMLEQTPGVEYVKPLLAHDRNNAPAALLNGGIEAMAVEVRLTDSPGVTARFDAVDATFASAAEALARESRAEFREAVEQGRALLEHEVRAGSNALAALLEAIDRGCTVRRDDRRVVVEARLAEPADQVANWLTRIAQQAGDRSFRPQHVVETAVRRVRLKGVEYKLKEIGIAMHNYHDTYKHFPSATSRRGSTNLSWRVTLLPFLGEHRLYEKFALNEPWDSPTNKPLIKEIPPHYFDPALPEGQTRFQVFVGKGVTFGLERPEIRNIRDGTSNTVMVVQAGTDQATPWTKPGGLEYQAGAPAATLGKIGDNFWTVFADGRVLQVPSTVSPADFRRMTHHDDGEPFDDFRR